MSKIIAQPFLSYFHVFENKHTYMLKTNFLKLESKSSNKQWAFLPMATVVWKIWCVGVFSGYSAAISSCSRNVHLNFNTFINLVYLFQLLSVDLINEIRLLDIIIAFYPSESRSNLVVNPSFVCWYFARSYCSVPLLIRIIMPKALKEVEIPASRLWERFIRTAVWKHKMVSIVKNANYEWDFWVTFRWEPLYKSTNKNWNIFFNFLRNREFWRWRNKMSSLGLGKNYLKAFFSWKWLNFQTSFFITLVLLMNNC